MLVGLGCLAAGFIAGCRVASSRSPAAPRPEPAPNTDETQPELDPLPPFTDRQAREQAASPPDTGTQWD